MSSWNIPRPESGRGAFSLTFAFPLARTKLPRARHSSVVNRPGHLPQKRGTLLTSSPKSAPFENKLDFNPV